VLFALVHLVLRRLFGFDAGGSESQSQSKDVEILVLRSRICIASSFHLESRGTYGEYWSLP